MFEHHQIVSDAHGEALPDGAVGVRVRFRLSGCPSSQWSRALRAHLSSELVDHAAAGHLRLNDIVQGDQIVLEGVEASEAATLAASLRRAVEATNQAATGGTPSAGDVAQGEADAVAHQMTLGVDRP